MTLRQLQTKLAKYPSKVANESLKILKQHTPVGPSGNLYRSQRIMEQAKDHCVVGTDLSYARDVIHGGNWYHLKNDYRGNRASIHNPTNSFWSSPIPGKRADGRANPNPYVEEARYALKDYDWEGLFWK